MVLSIVRDPTDHLSTFIGSVNDSETDLSIFAPARSFKVSNGEHVENVVNRFKQ
jgi:hypothetical protein